MNQQQRSPSGETFCPMGLLGRRGAHRQGRVQAVGSVAPADHGGIHQEPGNASTQERWQVPALPGQLQGRIPVGSGRARRQQRNDHMGALERNLDHSGRIVVEAAEGCGQPGADPGQHALRDVGDRGGIGPPDGAVPLGMDQVWQCGSKHVTSAVSAANSSSRCNNSPITAGRSAVMQSAMAAVQSARLSARSSSAPAAAAATVVPHTDASTSATGIPAAT